MGYSIYLHWIRYPLFVWGMFHPLLRDYVISNVYPSTGRWISIFAHWWIHHMTRKSTIFVLKQIKDLDRFVRFGIDEVTDFTKREYNGISCYIMLYHVISWYIMIYHHGISCYIILYDVISCHIIMLYHVISCYIMLYHVISWYIMIYHDISSCYIMLYHVVSSCFIMIYHVISCYIMIYHHVISCYIFMIVLLPYLCLVYANTPMDILWICRFSTGPAPLWAAPAPQVDANVGWELVDSVLKRRLPSGKLT